MLIIPFDRKIDWSRPPIATLLLVIINAAIYFGWQSGDEQRMAEALSYYQTSGLAQLEMSAYKKQLEEQGKPVPKILQKGDQNRSSVAWGRSSLRDLDFMRLVRSEQLIPSDADVYQEWRTKRSRFDERMSQVVYWQYGLKPAFFEPIELLSHMFLHANFMHLFGNMFFLFAVGFLVERTFGSGAYLACYLLTGLGGAAFDFTFTPDRLMPGIGASGAVSGLMGMYAVLFWTRRIRFFYFFFVIFGFATLPAIVLLPVWIANELYQLLANPGSNINYLAHLGGLISGGGIALLVRKYLPSFSLRQFDQEDQSEILEQQLAEAIGLCDQLEYREARPILARLHAAHPDDDRVLHYFHQCSRMEPEKEEYHRLSRKILSRQDFNNDANQWVLSTFRDYVQRAKPAPRLDHALVVHLADRFIYNDQLEEAERLVAHLLKKGDKSGKALELATSLGQKLLQSGDVARGKKYLAYVEKLQ